MPTHVLLGRAAGLTPEKLAHLGESPLPEDVYSTREAALVRYAQASTRMDPITDELYGALAEHFDVKAMIELCFTVGLAGAINRFHATFHTDVDEVTTARLARDPSSPRSPSSPGRS